MKICHCPGRNTDYVVSLQFLLHLYLRTTQMWHLRWKVTRSSWQTICNDEAADLMSSASLLFAAEFAVLDVIVPFAFLRRTRMKGFCSTCQLCRRYQSLRWVSCDWLKGAKFIHLLDLGGVCSKKSICVLRLVFDGFCFNLVKVQLCDHVWYESIRGKRDYKGVQGCLVVSFIRVLFVAGDKEVSTGQSICGIGLVMFKANGSDLHNFPSLVDQDALIAIVEAAE